MAEGDKSRAGEADADGVSARDGPSCSRPKGVLPSGGNLDLVAPGVLGRTATEARPSGVDVTSRRPRPTGLGKAPRERERVPTMTKARPRERRTPQTTRSPRLWMKLEQLGARRVSMPVKASKCPKGKHKNVCWKGGAPPNECGSQRQSPGSKSRMNDYNDRWRSTPSSPRCTKSPTVRAGSNRGDEMAARREWTGANPGWQ